MSNKDKLYRYKRNKKKKNKDQIIRSSLPTRKKKFVHDKYDEMDDGISGFDVDKK